MNPCLEPPVCYNIIMSLDDAVQSWKRSAQEDWDVAEGLLRDKKYSYALFFVQQAIEKLIKGLHIKLHDDHPLFVHNLVLLAQKTEAKFTDEELEQLKEITTFNISARYDSYKREFYQKATGEYSKKWFETAKKIKIKLLSQI